MKYKISLFTLIVAFVLGIVYIILINAISTVFIGNSNINSENTFISSSGTNINIGFSDNVDVAVTRHRWYGTIYESNGESNLRLFNYIKMPMRSNGFNYLIIHLVVLFMLISITMIVYIVQIIINNRKKSQEKQGEIDDEYLD